jgi:FKBP-type peptidyl-prolyl cis-trans isomerase FklB
MKSNKLLILTISLFLILAYSCKKDDTAEIVAKWKTQNETYFNNMKDSAGYVLYEIPSAPAGYSYYYKITTAGNQISGSPLSTDSVYVNYRGRTISGTVFDQTYSGKTPVGDANATARMFKLNRLISGWTYNLMQMKVGEIRTIVLPQQLAYGSDNTRPIMPYSTLIFDIQLVSYKTVAH